MTISDKLDYISNGKINKTSMKYIIEIDQEFHKKDKEIERLNNIMNKLEKYLIRVKETSSLQEQLMAKNVLDYINELKEGK